MLYCKKTHKWGVQKKFSKTINKEIWDCSIGGHCVYTKQVDSKYNSEFEETLVKESYEELGLDIKISKNFENKTGYIFKNYLYKNHFNNEYLGIGIIFTNSETISPIDGEVVDFKWLSLNELESLLKDRNVSDTLKTIFPFIEEEFETSIQNFISL
ncbi:MAG: NUDIX domain-containing protein [Candidatus Nanoarchaeia archaeon]